MAGTGGSERAPVLALTRRGDLKTKRGRQVADGTGQQADRNIAVDIARNIPIALAGGTVVNANLAGGDIVIFGGLQKPMFAVKVTAGATPRLIRQLRERWSSNWGISA